MNTKSKLSQCVFNQEVMSIDQNTFKAIDYYYKTKDIIERTNIALGRRRSFEELSTSTSNSQINTNAIKSTQKI